ncbi:tRNAse Z TRZ4, mitochondrial-like [Lycium barbarum]|uniref:tRNAse Z TRZ4, mitochondrial-like n=1 Tax=Lycium barbarum TaxID=112863 RepID=UPI00293F3BCD|nr:tRNAse Z TRZ4, mitochondrial-like [Lycium barbarum]
MNNGSPESTGHVDIWGPPNLDLLVNAMKNFVPHATMVNKHIIPDDIKVHENGSALAPSLHMLELKDKHKFKAVSISAILLSPTQLARSQFRPNDASIVYICKLHDIRGNFDPVKVKACGLKQGRKLAELEKGFSVKSDLLDIEVHPDDVIGPPIEMGNLHVGLNKIEYESAILPTVLFGQRIMVQRDFQGHLCLRHQFPSRLFDC